MVLALTLLTACSGRKTTEADGILWQQRDLLERIAAANNPHGSTSEKMTQLYLSAMDSLSLNARGTEPIRRDLQRIDGCQTRDELFRLMTGKQVEGMRGPVDIVFPTDSGSQRIHLVATNEGDWFLSADSTATHAAYAAYITKMFAYCGIAPAAEAPARAERLIALETRLTDDSAADAGIFTIDSLCRTFPGCPWNIFFDIFGCRKVHEVIVEQPHAIQHIADIWCQTPLDILQDYVRLRLINAAASYLDDQMRATYFEFYGHLLAGTTHDQPRWQRAVTATMEVFGPALQDADALSLAADDFTTLSFDNPRCYWDNIQQARLWATYTQALNIL